MKGNARNETEFDRICINRQTLETGNSVKLLGTVRPFVYYVPVGGGGGFQKSVVYQNFTFPQSNYSMEIVLPFPPPPPPPWQ